MLECGNSMSTTFYEVIDVALMTSVAEQFSAKITPQVLCLRANNWVITSRLLDRQCQTIWLRRRGSWMLCSTPCLAVRMRTSDFDLTRYDRQENLVLWWEFGAQIMKSREEKKKTD